MIDFLSISITNGILILLLITVLIFFCLYLYSDNKILKKQIEELRQENKSLLEKKIKKQESVDAISIHNISNEKINIDYNERLKIKEEKNTKEKDNNIDINITPSQEEKSIEPKEQIYNPPQNNFYNTQKKSIPNDFNLSDLINKNTNISLNKIEKNNEYDYLQELSNKLNEELKPQTIELTEYEKKQEEQAVISYKELLKFKDNNYILDEKQETVNFIEELKNLRNSLK